MISGNTHKLSPCTSSALTRTSSHTNHCSVKPSLRRNHPHRRTTIAISPVTGTAPIDASRNRNRDLAIEIGEIAIAISPIAIEIAPIAIAISPRTQFVLPGFLTKKLICSSGFYLSF